MLYDVEVIASCGQPNNGEARTPGQVTGIEQIRITGRRSPELATNPNVVNNDPLSPNQRSAGIADEGHRPDTPHTPMEVSTVLKQVSKLPVGPIPPVTDIANAAIQPCENPEDILAGMTISKMKTSHPSFSHQQPSPRSRGLTVKPVDLKNAPDIHVVSGMRPPSPSMTLKSFGRPLSADLYKLEKSAGAVSTGPGKSLDSLSSGVPYKLEAAVVGETVGNVDFFSDSLFDEEKAKGQSNNILNPIAVDRLAKSSTLIQQIQQQHQLKAEIYASKTPNSGALSPKNMGQAVYLPASPRLLAAIEKNNNALTLSVTGNNNILNSTGAIGNPTMGATGMGANMAQEGNGMVLVTSLNRVDQPDSHYFINSKDMANTSKLQLMKTMSQLRHYKTGTSPERKVHLIQEQFATSNSAPDLVSTMRTSNIIKADGNGNHPVTDDSHPSCTCGNNGRPLSPLQHQQHQPQCPVHRNRFADSNVYGNGHHHEPRVMTTSVSAMPRPLSSSSKTRPRTQSPTQRAKEEALERMRKMNPNSPAAAAAMMDKAKKVPIPGGAMSKYPIDHKDLVVKPTPKVRTIPHILTTPLIDGGSVLSMNSSYRADSEQSATPLYTPATFRKPKPRDTSADSVFQELEFDHEDFSPLNSPTTRPLGIAATQKADDASLQDSQVTTDSYKDDEKEGFLQSSMRSVKEEEENEQNKLFSKLKEKDSEIEVTASATAPNSAKSAIVTGQLNLDTLGSNFQKNSSKFSIAMSAKSTSTVPKKVRKKYLRDGRDLTRAPSPSRSQTHSPIRSSDNQDIKDAVVDLGVDDVLNNTDESDNELEEKSTPQLMPTPGPGHPNNIQCTLCLDKEAILWCTRCVKAFCGICWNRVNHHALYKSTVSTRQQDQENEKEKKKLHFRKLKSQQSTSSLRPFNESTASLVERSHYPPGKSYSHSIHFTSYVGDDELKPMVLGTSTAAQESGMKFDRNLILAPVPHIDNPVVHFVDYPNPPVFLDGKGNIHQHQDKSRFSGANKYEPNFHDGFTGKLSPYGPLRPFSSPAAGKSRYIMDLDENENDSPKSRHGSPSNLSRVGSQSETPGSRRSLSPLQSRPQSAGADGGRLVTKKEIEDNAVQDGKIGEGGMATTSHVGLEMNDSIASSSVVEFRQEITSSVHYVTKHKMLELMTGRKMPMKMSNIPSGKQIYLRKSLPYEGRMKKKKSVKPAFALSGGSGTMTIAKYGAPPKYVEQLKGISYDLNNTIDWKKGVFQAGAYYGTENPQRPHTSHGVITTSKEHVEVKPVRIKICHGIPVYVIKKDKL